ncbi:hypothetical protein D9M71_551940 [compost metagenome]
MGRRRHRLPRLPAARQPGAPAVAADSHRRGAGQHASRRGQAGGYRRPAPCAGQGDRPVESRRLPPGDGLRAGVLPARRPARRQRPPATGAGCRRRPAAQHTGLWPARTGTDRAVPRRSLCRLQGPGHSGAHGDFRVRAGPGGNHPGTWRCPRSHGPGGALQAPGQGRGAQARNAGVLHGQALLRSGRHRHAHARLAGRCRGSQPVRQRPG